MKRTGSGITLLLLFAAASVFAQSDPWKRVGDALGRAGREQPDGTYVVSLPRGDIDVAVAGIRAAPVLWMASAVTFSGAGAESLMMGDVLLKSEELAPAIARLVKEGITVAAVHNHLNGETPRLMFVHIEGHGDAVKIADSLKRAFSGVTFTPPNVADMRKPSTEELTAIEQILSLKGRIAGGGIVMNVARKENVAMHGVRLPASMGVSSTLLFQPLDGGRSAIAGDLVLLDREVGPVERALVAGGIEITALHSHMLGEEPRLFFLHYWAVDETTRLINGLKAALASTGH
jgi:hypothetical protein